MQYTISNYTFKNYEPYFSTTIFKNDAPIFSAFGETIALSRLNAIKLAMLLAIQESEQMMNGKIKG